MSAADLSYFGSFGASLPGVGPGDFTVNGSTPPFFPSSYPNAGPSKTPQTPNASSDAPWWTSLITTGANIGGTILGYELQKQQIKSGQTPSIAYQTIPGQPGLSAPVGQSVAGINLSTTAGKAFQTGLGASLGSIPIGIWAVILIIVFLLFKGRR
jgi:hypothetical protein